MDNHILFCCLGGAHDSAAGEPQVPVPLQEEVHHPQREEETEHRLSPALPLPHTHQWQRTLHQARKPAPFVLQRSFVVFMHGGFQSPINMHPPFLYLRTIQIGTDSSNLNSEFCFILKVWIFNYLLFKQLNKEK